MANLSITTAWNETVEFVAREANLVFPISFLLLALPRALVEATAPQPAAPGQAAVSGLWLLMVLVAVVALTVGYIAVSYLALRSGVSVADALRRGARRLPALLGAGLLLGIVLIVFFFIVMVVAVILVPGALTAAETGAAATPAMMRAILLGIFLIMPFALYFSARLLLMTPIAAAESANPFQLMARSWQLTAGNVWKLIGFLLLIGILVGVLTFAIRAVAGILFALVAGPLEPGSTSSWLVIVVMALVNMVVAAYLVSLTARIYAQLSGDTEQHRVFA